MNIIEQLNTEQIRELNKDIPDLRTAAMMVSIKRIAQSYGSLGI